MTGPARGGTERSARTSSRSAGIPGAVAAVAVVLAIGLALRFIIAYVLLPGSGFITDVVSFRAWAAELAAGGPYGFYDRVAFADYTPGYLYVLWLVGVVGSAIGGIGDLVKLPAILADAALGWLVWSMARELGARQGVALLGAALVVLNPVTWFDSAVWGQVDAFGAVFLLLALRELWRDRPERAAVLTVAAAIIKPQLGILVPLVAVVTIRRALWPRGAYGDDPPPERPATPPGAGAGERFRAWERRTDRPVRILTTALAGFVTAVVLAAPFGLSVVEPSPEAPFIRSGLLEQVGVAAGGYPYTTVNAYNPWALIPGDLGYSLAADGYWICDTPNVAPNDSGGDRCSTGTVTFGPIPAVLVGTTLLLASIALVLWLVARSPDRATLLVGLALLAMAFFVVPTRVHERYMFPFFALGAILAAVSIRWRLAYVVLSAATFANLYVVLTTLFDHSAVGVVDWLGIGQALRSAPGVTIVAMVHLVAFAWGLAQLRADSRERLADEIAEAGAREPLSEDAPAAPGDASPGHEAAPHRPAVVAPPEMRLTTAPPPDDEPASPTTMRPGAAEGPALDPLPAAVDPLAARRRTADDRLDRLAGPSIRADRSLLLRREGGGRIDRLDVWLLIVLVVATLVLRTFRLGEPPHFHFDEVHHVQTAAEFLQVWRYGESQDIYEWTHPHLGKYVLAGGIALLGDNRVSATSAVGSPVFDALVEPRRTDPFGSGQEVGDRLYVAADDGLRVYDLASRDLIATLDVAQPRALTLDDELRQLFVGTADGDLYGVDLAAADGGAPLEPFLVATWQPVDHLLATGDGTTLVAASGDELAILDRDSGEVLASASVAGLADLAEAGTGPAVVSTPGDVPDPAAAAQRLVEILGGDAADYEERLALGEASTVITGIPDDAARTDIDEAIAAGELPGIEVADLARIAVAGTDGIVFLEVAGAAEVARLDIAGGAHGLTRVHVDSDQLYATTGPPDDPSFTVVSLGGDEATSPEIASTNFLPGPGTRIAFNDATEMVHVLGRTQDGAGWTVYVIEPHANAPYADAVLPFEPSALAWDIASERPQSDRQQLLAFAGDEAGSVATVEIGGNPFAWRLPGVVAGALMAGLLYLLARILFRRRDVAVLAGAFALLDGMLFAHSRIGMIDAVLGLCLVAAYVVFALLWTERWRGRWAFWVLLPIVGMFLGLALATKWIAAYSIGAIALLLLVRSALGRIVAIAGLVGITVVLGYMAMSVPEGQAGFGNVPFLLLMVALTLVAVVVTVTHPIAWSTDEFRFAVLAPAAGAVVVFFGALALGRETQPVAVGPLEVTPLEVALVLAILAPVVYGLFVVAGRAGFGPLARVPAPDDPVRLLDPPAAPPTAWLRPGWLLGLPLVWAAISLVVIPLAIYVASYLPWAAIENHRIIAGFPAGHTGQTLADLTAQMYRYHDQLTAEHAASSPWWAWPFNLKPVWFYQESFDTGTAASIYDAGNLVIWWIGVPALAFVAWQAYRRRSLALALIAIGFAAQWVPWARIDRAAFQYHYYTALPFVILALAYFVAELWHGPSRRTWLLAKAAAAAAIVAPAVLHLLSRPLCWAVGVEPGPACPELIPSFVLTARTALLAAVLVLGGLFLIREVLLLGGRGRDGSPTGSLLRLGVTAAIVAVAMLGVALVGDGELLRLENVPVEPIALVVAVPLGWLALQVLRARDPRRFVGGLLVAVVATFVAFYPNISGLRLPSAVVNAYQGLLPTYLYYFDFPVNTAERNAVTPLFTPMLALLLAAVAITCLVVAYSAWSWRIVEAERAAGERGIDATVGSAGPAPG